MAVAHVRRGRRWRCNGRGAEQRLGVWTDVSMAGVMLRLFTFHFTRSWANKPNIDGSYRTGPRGAQRGRTNTERKGESSADGWRVGTKTQRDNEGRRGVSALSAKFCIASASATHHLCCVVYHSVPVYSFSFCLPTGVTRQYGK